MDVELLEIRDFLGDYPPFSLLSAEILGALVPHIRIAYLRRGSPFPPADEPSPVAYLVRKGAIEQRDEAGLLCAKFAEGDLVADACEAVDGAAAIAVEDCLLYCLPCEELRQLRRSHGELDAYFARSLTERLRHGRRTEGPGLRAQLGAMEMQIGEFVGRAPITVGSACSIADAARRMSEEAISSLMVVDEGRLVGIVTDRDLRIRCLAAGVSPQQPVSSIMSREVLSVGSESALFEALMLMTRHGIDHLPVVDADGLRGLVSSRDLLRSQSSDALHLATRIRRCPNIAGLPALSVELVELQIQLHAAGATAAQIGRSISAIVDALSIRLIELAGERLGPPPLPFAWVACGSQGRHEQTTHSDQDNALILGEGFAGALHADYFAELADIVNDGLDACGFRYCPGKVMASNPRWRQTLPEWVDTFRLWIHHPDAVGAMLAVNFADMRVVAGDARLYAELHAQITAEAMQREAFSSQLVANTLVNRPPLGIFRNFVLIGSGEHEHTLDIKTSGLIPLVDIVRIEALRNGVAEVNTCRRLHALAARGKLGAEAAAELEEAFEFLSALRVRHQVEQLRAGIAPDNFIDPDRLTSLERRHLKDVFSVIGDLQRILESRHAKADLA